ncbi:MAG TPA: RNA polymerase sigma factor [Candidatus Dormibacteraeota bacterium]|nr:RNA polymerase sigma factor [Candidatus Dormibacteraeota bacterium]
MSEIDLLRRARQGDRYAFEEVLRPVIQPAFRLALAMLCERGAAEDAVQEMALKGWRHRHRIRPELGTARPWFLAIVANECRMARRQRWWSVLRYAEPVERPAGERDVAGRLDLRAQIDRLAYNDRLLLHLYYVLDLPAVEVAQVLGIRIGAVKSRLHRVTRRLRSRLVAAEVSS